MRKRYLRYRVAGKRRWFVAARRQRAYVWQQGRFGGDLEIWRKGLSRPGEVSPVKEGRCLSFCLYTEPDFQFFQEAATAKLLGVTWTEPGGLEDAEDDTDDRDQP